MYLDSYIPRDEAWSILQRQARQEDQGSDATPDSSKADLSNYDRNPRDAPTAHDVDDDAGEMYELMRFQGSPYLCSIPIFAQPNQTEVSEPVSEAEQQKEVARATDRGWQLLQDLDGKCLYYVSGWWSYSFCYNSQIKQFHQLPPGQGAPIYPPQEDHSTPSYVLGRFQENSKEQRDSSSTPPKDVAELQTKGETRYLVQKLGGGTTCDLTGKDRKVEVQFHCHPQSTDRIGFIKEVTTCTYLMVVYTPRLCNDVAFLPPQENKPHPITCREILRPEQVTEWQARKEADTMVLDGKPSSQKMAGNIEVGGNKLVGGDGRRIEKGKVVTPPEERADIVAKKEKGQVRQLSKEDMEKMDIDPETVNSFREKLQDIAGNKDWKLEVVDEVNGVRHIRGVVQGDGEQDGEAVADEKSAGDDEEQEGSQEEYKEEL